jgi:hypothetical protein
MQFLAGINDSASNFTAVCYQNSVNCHEKNAFNYRPSSHQASAYADDCPNHEKIIVVWCCSSSLSPIEADSNRACFFFEFFFKARHINLYVSLTISALDMRDISGEYDAASALLQMSPSLSSIKHRRRQSQTH